MFLTKKEEQMCDGEFGETIRKSMDILVALGDIYGASKLVDITSAQVSGVSYKTIGDAGLDFVVDLGKKADVELETMLNPAGVDIENWKELGFSEEFTKKQIEMGNETILTIAKAVDARDENTSHHSARVAEYSTLIAKELKELNDNFNYFVKKYFCCIF